MNNTINNDNTSDLSHYNNINNMNIHTYSNIDYHNRLSIMNFNICSFNHNVE